MFSFKGTALCFYVLLVLVLATNQLPSYNLDNHADVDVTCDESAMMIQMNFTLPFRGLVLTPDNYFNSSCSYAASPVSSLKSILFVLPYGSCGMKVLQESNVTVASNNIIIVQNRMITTRRDYVQNVSCQVPASVEPAAVVDLDVRPDVPVPRFESWLSFELGSQLYDESVADDLGISEELMLAYHVKDGGLHRDMIVMNCVGHDALELDNNTRVHQLSDPFGCASESDVLSNFTVITKPNKLIAYASIKNMSLVTRGRFYVSCAAQLCKDNCQRNCSDESRRDVLYFSDIAVKGMVNRSPGSKAPMSLDMLDRADRLMRSERKYVVDPVLKLLLQDYAKKLMDELPKSTEYSYETTATFTTTESNKSDEEAIPRVRRSVDFQNSGIRSNEIHLVVLKSGDGNFKNYNYVSLHANTTSQRQSDVKPGYLSNDTDDSRVNSELLLKNLKYDVIKFFKQPGYGVFACTFKTALTIIAILCVSVVIYTLFFVKRRPQTFDVASHMY